MTGNSHTDKPGRPMRVGLTGGIASGKSTVANMFAKLGAPVIDTDIIAREVVATGSAGLAAVGRVFGDAVIAADGSLDRPEMRKIVFSDEQRRRELEAILHPLIREETVRQLAEVSQPYVIVVVPLLVESPMKALMDRIVVVDCTEETQIARLMNRDIETEDQARRIMATQASREDRLALADDIINNDDNVARAQEQVEALHKSYQRLARKMQQQFA